MNLKRRIVEQICTKGPVAVVYPEGTWYHSCTPEALERLKDELIRAGSTDRLDLKGLSKDRTPVFPGGVATLMAVFQGLGIKRMWSSDGALREGLLYDMIGRKEHDSVREQAVAALMQRYAVPDGASLPIRGHNRYVMGTCKDALEGP